MSLLSHIKKENDVARRSCCTTGKFFVSKQEGSSSIV